MARYLRDRRTGEKYGWNFEMAKLPYMKEIDSDDDDFDQDVPDPSYDDPDAPKVTEPVFPVAALEDDAAQTVKAAVDKAAAQGEAALVTEDEAPEYDKEGHALLGYAEDDSAVYETDEERDDRLADEAAAEAADAAAAEAEAAATADPTAELDEPEPEPEPKPKSKKK
jgi:hypothetical protein